MKISFDKKILFGFVINLLILIGLGWVYFVRTKAESDHKSDYWLDWLEYSLFALVFILVIIVYFIIRSLFMIKNSTKNIIFKLNSELFIKKLSKKNEIKQSIIYLIFTWYHKKLYGKNYHAAFKEFYPDYNEAIKGLNPVVWNETSIIEASQKIKLILEIK